MTLKEHHVFRRVPHCSPSNSLRVPHAADLQQAHAAGDCAATGTPGGVTSLWRIPDFGEIAQR